MTSGNEPEHVSTRAGTPARLWDPWRLATRTHRLLLTGQPPRGTPSRGVQIVPWNLIKKGARLASLSPPPLPGWPEHASSF